MHSTIEKKLEEDGWTVVCESPFELEHNDGSVATGYGAKLVVESYENENKVAMYNHIQDIVKGRNEQQEEDDEYDDHTKYWDIGTEVECVVKED